MICMDNSDYMRNCDYGPNRFEAQADAVHLLCGAKTQQHSESSVGILTVAGDRVEVLVTPTTDLGQMISGLPSVVVGGEADFLRGLQVAQLALKHRQNKNQKQRIVAFIGSPISAPEKELETLGKNLKKNNVSLDLVSFGEIGDNTEKLQKLLAAVNSNDMSHVLEVPAGPKLLSDALLSSAIIYPDGDAPFSGGDGFGSGDGFDFGDDPELALALRISMEEERARQEKLQLQSDAETRAVAASAEAAGDSATAAGAEAGAASGPSGGELPIATDASLMEALGEDMDDELRQALLASLQEEEKQRAPAAAGPSAEEAAPAASAPEEASPAPEAPAPPSAAAAMEEDAAPKGDKATAPEAGPTEAAAGEVAAAAPKDPVAPAGANVAIDTRWFQDAAFVQELLGSLPGVDINDQAVQSAIRQAQERASRPPSSGGGAPK